MLLARADPRFVELARTHWPTEPRFVCAEDPRTYSDVVVQRRRQWQWSCCGGAALRLGGVVSHPLLGQLQAVEGGLPDDALLWRPRDRPLELPGDADEIEALLAYATTPTAVYCDEDDGCEAAGVAGAPPLPRDAVFGLRYDGQRHRVGLRYAESPSAALPRRAVPPLP